MSPLAFLRPCPFRVVTKEEIRAVAGSAQFDRAEARYLEATERAFAANRRWMCGDEAAKADALRLAGEAIALQPDYYSIRRMSNSRRWR